MVGEGSVAVTVKAIPGLKYTLLRAEVIGSGGFVETALPVGEPVVATGATVTLEDGDPPADKAFYKVNVGK